MADVYLDMSGEDESGEKCGQEIQKRRFPTYPGEASQSMEGPYLSGKMVEMEAPGVGKRNRTAGINPAGDELQSAAMASKTSLSTHISFGSVSLSGRAREMEDAISVQPGFVQFQDACTPFHFFAVFDGHGGSHVSALCKEMMHSVLAEEIMAEPARGVSSGAEETRWKSAVERCFRRMDRLALSACACGRVGEPTCTCERSGIESDVVGSTAVIAVVGGGRLLIANCGDSRAVLSRGGRTVPLSVDHKPDRPDELARIEAAGGRVIYVNGARVHGILAMSRALGSPTISQNVSFDELTGKDEDEDPCAVGEPDHTARAGSRTDAARGGDAVEAKALASEASAPCIKANAGVGVGEPPLHAIDAGTPATKRLIGPVPAVGENLTANCSSGSLAGPTDSSSVERPSVSKGANAPSEDAAEPP